MAHPGKTYDVFIAHSVRDAGLALEVASAWPREWLGGGDCVGTTSLGK